MHGTLIAHGFPVEEEAWDSVFSRLTPEDKALAVMCPKCKSLGGYSCRVRDGKEAYDCAPHPERIRLVQELETGESGKVECAGANESCSVCGVGYALGDEVCSCCSTPYKPAEPAVPTNRRRALANYPTPAVSAEGAKREELDKLHGSPEPYILSAPAESGERWLVVFEDTDRGNAVFTERKEALAYYEKACVTYNCYLFEQIRPTAQPAEGERGIEDLLYAEDEKYIFATEVNIRLHEAHRRLDAGTVATLRHHMESATEMREEIRLLKLDCAESDSRGCERKKREENG